MSTIELHRSQNNNLTRLSLGPLDIYFSYETIVAYALPELGRRVSENVWSSTTGRHLNAIDGGSPLAKTRRIPAQSFREEVTAILETALRDSLESLLIEAVEQVRWGATS